MFICIVSCSSKSFSSSRPSDRIANLSTTTLLYNPTVQTSRMKEIKVRLKIYDIATPAYDPVLRLSNTDKETRSEDLSVIYSTSRLKDHGFRLISFGNLGDCVKANRFHNLDLFKVTMDFSIMKRIIHCTRNVINYHSLNVFIKHRV